MHMDSRTIIAAILHDVVEDTDTSINQLSILFGNDVAHLVDGVSKVSALETDSKLNAEAMSFQKMFMAMAKDIRVIIIKLADRLHNMGTLDALRAEKKQRIAKQTLEIYAPIADRLGMRDLCQKLEDLSFQTLYPKRFRAISRKLSANKRGRKSVIAELCKSIRGSLADAGVDAEVLGREKTLFSIYRKMRRKRLPLKSVQDVNAIRVITTDRNSCYHVLGVIHRLYTPRHESFKDYIAIPKRNGYQSLHTVVMGPFGQNVEIQIRDREMHKIAEKGVASHWYYKTDGADEKIPQKLAQQWLDSFLESQEKSSDSSEYLEHLKADLHPDEVYVFTPKGEIKQLPRNATALDFAYAVHSDIGNHCVGATVDGRQVPLHERLNNGETVKAVTSRKARPQPSWLNYAVSSKARSSIRHFLNQQKDKEAIRLGSKLLKKALKDRGYSNAFGISNQHKIRLLERLELKDWNQLLLDIGFGKRLPALVAKQFLLEIDDSNRAHRRETGSHGSMTIEGTERLLVTYANCCHPIPGDKIIGTTTSGSGLSVHRLRCKNCVGIMKHPDNYFHLNWSDETQGRFRVMLDMETANRPGVLARVSNIIAEHDSNINQLNVDDELTETSRMSFIIEVTSRDHLADIMWQLHNDENVLKLARS